MTLTIDKLFKDSLSEFMDFGDNNSKYKNHNLQAINIWRSTENYAHALDEIIPYLPQDAEAIVNFKIEVPSDKWYNVVYVSGTALIPKPNNRGSNVND